MMKWRKKARRDGRVPERDVRAAYEDVDRGVRFILDLAAKSARYRQWDDVAEDLIGIFDDLAPELRLLREARRHGVALSRASSFSD